VSPPNSTSTLQTPTPARSAGSHRKPKADLYTVFLVVALLAVLLGILFLCLYMNDYNWQLKGAPAVTMGGTAISGERLAACLSSPVDATSRPATREF
jgi:hypothetical protein